MCVLWRGHLLVIFSSLAIVVHLSAAACHGGCFRYSTVGHASVAVMSSSQQGKEAQARPPLLLLGTQVPGWVEGTCLSTAYSRRAQDMMTYTRGVWDEVPPYPAAVSSLGEIKLVFLCGNPCTHTIPVCPTHGWDSVVRGLIVTCAGRTSRYVVSVSIK